MDRQPDRRRAYLPPQASDLTVTLGGREVRWLSRLVGAVLAPLLRWRGARRGRRRP